MTPSLTARFVTKLAVAIALPGIPCFGYYTMLKLGDAGDGLSTFAVLAGPLALIGFVALIGMMLSGRRSRLGISLAVLCLVVPSVFLILVRA